MMSNWCKTKWLHHLSCRTRHTTACHYLLQEDGTVWEATLFLPDESSGGCAICSAAIIAKACSCPLLQCSKNKHIHEYSTAHGFSPNIKRYLFLRKLGKLTACQLALLRFGENMTKTSRLVFFGESCWKFPNHWYLLVDTFLIQYPTRIAL